jgi:hypothetical protein
MMGNKNTRISCAYCGSATMRRGIIKTLKSLVLLITSMMLMPLCHPATAQPVQSLRIDWEVANRFRLFATQAEFDRHVAAAREATDKTVLGAEQWLARQTDGRGWADTIGALCFDSFRGRILETCERDGHRETYLNALDARIKLTARLPADFGEAICEWTIGSGGTATVLPPQSCGKVVDSARASTRKKTPVALVTRNQSGETLQARIDVQVRDIFIVGLGDSIASGEGNPIHPLVVDDEGFCFRRALSGNSQDFYLPGRANISLVKSCESAGDPNENREIWDSAAAGWLYNQCHRSLYSYQMRAAIALAVENPQISVTFLPLGCSGAEIFDGVLTSMDARERPVKDGKKSPPTVESQASQLRNYLRSITDGRGRRRPIDLILLTIGANDIGFSGLVANIVVSADKERDLLKSVIVDTDDAADNLKDLRNDFRQLRTVLRGFTGGNLNRVLFTTYGNPAIVNQNMPCPDTRKGFDAHPAFAVNGATLSKTVEFVENSFIPTLRSYAVCGAGGGCLRRATDAMAYTDGHRTAFASHGFCATAADDPSFDQACFKDGESFQNGQNGLAKPMACNEFPRMKFLPYTKRARWIRTANDSYFAAMTYPASSGFLNNPIDIHDARWGLTSVVYGGAIHPTAEGHAAMADAALVEARRILGLPSSADGATNQ